jgi:hypothetical protein
MTLLPLRMAAAILLALSLPLTSHAEEHQTEKYRVNPPPSAELKYAIKAKQSGITLDGEALVHWQAANGKFLTSTETRAMLLGKILDTKSEGVIDDFGLAPVTFTEKRFRKDATTANFHRDSKSIDFSASQETYAIKGGEQDRNSAIWQLVSVARAAPEKFKPGSTWTFFVVGQRDAETWSFRVTKLEKINTPHGQLDTVRVVKAPPPDQKGQQVELWLAPGMDWYPARIRYNEPDGDFIEQSLATVTKKPG